LTDRPLEGAAPETLRPHGRGDVLARALSRARLTILWERLWPALAAVAVAVGLFLAVSWIGTWLWLPPIGRAIGLGLFFLLTAAAFAPMLLVRVPTRSDGLRRLDRNTGRLHRPATAIADDLAVDHKDSFAVALWHAHVERALRAAKTLRAGRPSPGLAARDPYAIRALVLMLVITTFFAAGNERLKRITAAFDWQGVIVPANFRIDAWISPPAYTGKPPVILAGLRPGELAPSAAANVTIPAGSTLIIRASGEVKLDVATKGGLVEVKDDAKTDTKPNGRPIPPGTEEHRYTINEAGAVTLHSAVTSDLTWQFTAIPDKPPTIALAKDPEPQLRGALQLSYKLEDDYGVVGAQATFALKPGSGTNGQPPRPLFEAPDFPLVLPQARTKSGIGATTKDLSDHAWAGSEVVMTLTARDEGGNEGKSEPFTLTLPERAFTKPTAKALIEQRRNLALDAETQANVLNALDALTIAPDVFKVESSIYLGLRSIYYQLAKANSDDQLREVVARMWDMATYLEDGSVSDAEAALRSAEEQLRQALERGATDEEIKRLTDQLRAALDKFMQALAEQMRRNPNQQLARPLDQNQRQMRPQDLRNMIDRMEQMARNGARDAARQLLQQLQQMLENMQAMQGQQQMGDNDDDNMMDQLGDMIRRQQQLRDRTFQQGQDQRRQRGQQGQRNQRGQQGQQPQDGQQGDQNMADLQKEQQELQEQLNKLLEELKKRGLGQQQPGQQGQQGQRGQQPGQRGQQPGQGQQGQGQQGQGQGGEMDQLGEAGEAMGQAQGQLGDGNADGAVGSQGRALEALRRGAQSLAQSMQQQQGQGQMGPGPGQPGRLGQPRAQQQTDPLGRPLRGRDYGDDVTVKVPGEIDVQRARRILEELRRRFGESFRPQLELEYLERLLQGF
jgi:uncharacterized protein (TIGR02302 family)